jgi:NitT/TauT family transport system permease protein
VTSILWPVGGPRVTRRRQERVDVGRFAIIGFSFVLFLLLWHFFATGSDSVFDMPTPWSTTQAAADMWSSGELRTASIESGQVLLLGTIPAVLLGVLMGLLIGGIRELDLAFSPYIFAFYTTPFVALIPIYLLIFGLDVVGKAAIVFSLVWVAVVIQTTAGVREVDPRFLEVARSFRASWWRQLFEIRLPAASSMIVAGMRLAIGRALVGVVVAEFDTAFAGLGALIFRYAQRFELAYALVPAVVLGAVGVLLGGLLRRAERRLERWRHVS